MVSSREYLRDFSDHRKFSLYLFYWKGLVYMAFEKVKCKECGAIFQPKNRKQQFCSQKCSTKFNRRSGSTEVWRKNAKYSYYHNNNNWA